MGVRVVGAGVGCLSDGRCTGGGVRVVVFGVGDGFVFVVGGLGGFVGFEAVRGGGLVVDMFEGGRSRREIWGGFTRRRRRHRHNQTFWRSFGQWDRVCGEETVLMCPEFF